MPLTRGFNASHVLKMALNQGEYKSGVGGFKPNRMVRINIPKIGVGVNCDLTSVSFSTPIIKVYF